MAVVRNLTHYPITLPNRILVPPKSDVTCDNSDLTAADVWPTLNTMTAAGDLAYDLDPPPIDEPPKAEPTTETPPDIDLAALETETPPRAGKASKG